MNMAESEAGNIVLEVKKASFIDKWEFVMFECLEDVSN